MMVAQPIRCLIIPLVVLATPAAAAEPVPRTISVAGVGKAASAPDTAVIQTGVVTQAKQARDALEANNTAMKKVMDALKAYEIADKDIQTSGFNVQPEYKRSPRGQQQQPEIVGYRVTNQVRVRVRKLTNLGKVLDTLVAAGSNQISGVSFGIDDPSSILNQARKRAVADARSRARLYAEAAGVSLGKVMSISEEPLAFPQQQYVGRAMAAEAVGAVPIATGEQEFQATVHMVFALEDAN